MRVKEFPILYVDDEKANRVVMKHSIGEDFTLLVAESGEHALKIMEKEFIAVLLADQRMPYMTGVDLAEKVRDLYPEMIRVIITAYSDLEATVDAINRGRVNRFIKKPWIREELVAVMFESVQAYHNSQIIKEIQERLTNLDRITALGIMASAIAHDMRQPLAYVVPAVELLTHDAKQLKELTLDEKATKIFDRMERGLREVTEGVDMLKTVSSSLLDSLNDKQMVTELVFLKEVVKNIVAITHSTVTRRAKFDLDLPRKEVYCYGSSSRLSQLLVNLLLNAVQAIEPGDKTNNKVSLRAGCEGEYILIEVQDTGRGIKEEDKLRIFNPFFSTRGQMGTGLGLTICRQIVDDHDGSIEVFSTPGVGSTFRVRLPWVKSNSHVAFTLD